MRKYNPFRNIFYYYRGPSSRKDKQFDKQIEDNTTKALINTFEHSENKFLKCFFDRMNLPFDSSKIYYDLQVSEELSRPDALIKVGDNDIYIESKIGSYLDKNQINRHLGSIENGFLVCVTSRSKDVKKIEEMNIGNLRFITWKEIYCCLEKEMSRSGTSFIVKQFLEYLEMINMSPFTGWEKRDFEAFLYREEDPRKELRMRVKGKLQEYLNELSRELKDHSLYNKLKVDVGNLSKTSPHVWGVLCIPPIKRKVDVPHFNFLVTSDDFCMGVQIEGKKPSNKMKKHIEEDKEGFLEILKGLDGFELKLRKRIEVRPRKFDSTDVVSIKLGDKDVTMSDVDYLINKMGEYDLFELNCGMSIKRDKEILHDESFLDKSVEFMIKLKDYYAFSLEDV